MTYQEEVAAAAADLKQGEAANWSLARRTHENTLGRGEYQVPGDKVVMERWCTDVRAASGRRFSVETGRLYRRIWEEKGEAYQSSTTDMPLSWSEARWAPEVTNLNRQSELDRVNAHHITHLASPETQAKVVEQLLDNPTIADRVAERVLSNPETVARVMRTESPASQAITVAVDTHRALAEVDQVLDRVFEHDAWLHSGSQIALQ